MGSLRRRSPRSTSCKPAANASDRSRCSWATRAGARVAGAPAAAVNALGQFGAHLGVAFQLVDDALDYAGDHSATGKALFVDLHEGKLTLPLLRAIAKRPALLSEVEAAR